MMKENKVYFSVDKQEVVVKESYMKKYLILFIISIFYLVGCSNDGFSETDNQVNETLTKKDSMTEIKSVKENNTTEDIIYENYNIGDEIELGGVKFNIYKIDDNKELHLLAQSNIATTKFSGSERSYEELHNYEGSLVEGYVNRFVDDLEDKGYNIKSSGIIDKDDLYNLGFVDSVTVSGRPYLCDSVPQFVKYEKNYWLDGYYKVDTYSWVYFNEKIDTESCEEKYGVRIVIEPSEINKQVKVVDKNLTIKDIVNSDCAWTSEGGIENPYDLFYFDCQNMLFINIFESSELSNTQEFSMEFVDEKTIRIDGVMRWYDTPAELTIVNENKLRLRFLDDSYNDGDYFLNKVNEEK